MGINRVILVGNLGADPETKKTSGGQTVTLFNLATSKTWVNREGQKQQHTEWHRIVVWSKLAETCAAYLSKGRQVYIEGRLQTRSWEDENKQKRYTTEVVAGQVLFLGNAAAGQSATTQTEKTTESASYQNEPAFSGEKDQNAYEDLPF